MKITVDTSKLYTQKEYAIKVNKSKQLIQYHVSKGNLKTIAIAGKTFIVAD